MTDVRQARQSIDRPSTEFRQEPRGAPGWVIFAGAMLLLAGAFQFIVGLTALLRESFFIVGTNSLLVHQGFTVWGWVHVGLGGALALLGLAAVSGRAAVRWPAILVALITAVVNLAFLPAFPIWAVLNIALDVLAIYSLSRWREFADRMPMATVRGLMTGGERTHDGHERHGVRTGDGSTTTSTTTTTTQQQSQGQPQQSQGQPQGGMSEEEESRRIAAERSSGRRQ